MSPLRMRENQCSPLMKSDTLSSVKIDSFRPILAKFDAAV